MSKGIIFFIFAFLAVVYIFTFIKWRKRKKKGSVSAIDEFKSKYSRESKREDKINSVLYDFTDDSDVDNRIDYIDKDEFVSQIQAEVNNSKLGSSNSQKKFELHF